jgi:hypothetical protein
MEQQTDYINKLIREMMNLENLDENDASILNLMDDLIFRKSNKINNCD